MLPMHSQYLQIITTMPHTPHQPAPAHQQTGQQGEDLAAAYLQARGYTILHRNWRYKHAEVDILASKAGTLHFMEVKTRTGYHHSQPEIAVTKKKLNMLKTAAEGYLHYQPQWKWIQFDVLAIVITPGQEPDIFMIEDVF